MATINKTPLAKTEFDGWATATKGTLNSIDDRLATVDRTLTGNTRRLVAIEERLAEHGQQLAAIEKKLEPLETIATELRKIRENTTAMLRLYDRLDHRDHVFARKLALDLKQIDADL